MGGPQSRKAGIEKPRQREEIVPVDRGERERKPIWPSALHAVLAVLAGAVLAGAVYAISFLLQRRMMTEVQAIVAKA